MMSSFRIGDTVRIQGLKNDSNWNGATGKIVDCRDGRWSVEAAGGMVRRIALHRWQVDLRSS